MKPDYLFEISWEVCNKLGGIYTVLSSKSESVKKEMGDNYFFVGPDVWKETIDNPDFLEDNSIHTAWRESARSEGLNIRIGRWNIPGKPIAILVDFTPFFPDKDKILASFWETYKLDSLPGGWDYIEPVLFGYAAGKVIESFYEFFLSAQDRIIAHFHEWMAGGGVLYLKNKVPQIGTVFTTHATTLGRSIAGNGMPLYRDLENYKPFEVARQLGVVSKNSMEYVAANQADSFATVSEVTAKECKIFLLKEPDVVTPNGFTDSFYPDEAHLPEKKRVAREKLAEIAGMVTGRDIDKDSFFIITSGRYEYRNKGLDVFIRSLGELNKNKNNSKKTVAFITVPGHHGGPVLRSKNTEVSEAGNDKYLTHILFNDKSDAILNEIKNNGLDNTPESNVTVIFVPAYLNGNDGVFNMDYYDLLLGFDLSVFPSYYEPWGYTPLESIAFRIPTITTDLAGFGVWIKDNCKIENNSVIVCHRTDDNEDEIVSELEKSYQTFLSASVDSLEKAANEAFGCSRGLLWDRLISKYREAYSIALDKVDERSDLFKGKQSLNLMLYTNGKKEKPVWKKVLVKTNFPKELEPLKELTQNLWWTWNYEARELFRLINPEKWKKSDHNPILLLDMLDYEHLQSLAKDKAFLSNLNKIYKKFKDYMSAKRPAGSGKIAYFSMEFGLCENLRIYSGGLGILAGDYLKQASDSNYDIVGVGLLYRYGYFEQSISLFGDQVPQYIPQSFSHLPLKPVKKDGEWVKVSLALPGRKLTAKVWQVDVGRIPLYLLDTDISENTPEDRFITHQLYGGDWHNRFKQELLLGVGGIRTINSLGLKPDVYHLNEGHAAFAGLERLHILVEETGLSFNLAVEVVRASSLFTTHTPVPAGHDAFTEDILRTYIPHYAERLNISWEDFMNLGRMHGRPDEKFSMSVLAANLSQEMNGVSKIHGRVSREMFVDLYDGYFPDELHIGYVTNGVHLGTWTEKHWQRLYDNEFGKDFRNDISNPEFWKKIHLLSDEAVWSTRQKSKAEFIRFLKDKVTVDLTKRQESPKNILRTVDHIDENALYIGFARRFATYKRAHLIFSNPERLAQILNHPEHPVRIIFAGKAHPNDKPGQDIIKHIVELSKKPEFAGRIIFLENYNMHVASYLVSGVDIWLNTPTRPLEASGTSGEKAVMNGVVNFSVLDGWWAEGYRENAGWAIQEARTYGNQQFQDELDAETIYDMLEDEIIPLYFDKSDDGISHKWVSYVKNTISEIAPHYTMKRMLDDYIDKFYNKLIDRSRKMQENNYSYARKVERWKRKIVRNWNEMEIVYVRYPSNGADAIFMGEKADVELEIKLNGLKAEDIGVELLVGKKENEEDEKVSYKIELELKDVKDDIATFKGVAPIEVSGMVRFIYRIYPKSDMLPHRMDFNLVRWV